MLIYYGLDSKQLLSECLIVWIRTAMVIVLQTTTKFDSFSKARISKTSKGKSIQDSDSKFDIESYQEGSDEVPRYHVIDKRC